MDGDAYRRVEMSKTVSFVARDELAEWLESRADAEKRTTSSLVEDIVREHYLRNSLGGEPAEEPQDVFERHNDAWYRPNSQKYEFAVDVPESLELSDAGKTRYYKTREKAAEALTRWYE